MIKMQYIKLLELRGITELEKGQSVQDTVDSSGGEPGFEELAKVNEMVFLYYMNRPKPSNDEIEKLKEIINDKQNIIKELEKKIKTLSVPTSGDIRSLLTLKMAHELRNVGVDGWDEFSDDIYDKEDDSRCYCNTIYHNKELDKYIEINYMRSDHLDDDYWQIQEVYPVIKPTTVYDLVGDPVKLS